MARSAVRAKLRKTRQSKKSAAFTAFNKGEGNWRARQQYIIFGKLHSTVEATKAEIEKFLKRFPTEKHGEARMSGWHWEQYFVVISLFFFCVAGITRLVALFWYGMLAYALISGGFFHG